MRTKIYKAYKVETVENALHEKTNDFVLFKNVELFIFKKGKFLDEKEGIDSETIIYNALAYSRNGLENGMFIEIDRTKYKIIDLVDFKHKVFFKLEEGC